MVGLFFLLKGNSENGTNGTNGTASNSAGGTAEDRVTTRNRLKVLGIALHNYYEVYNTLPPGAVFDAQGRGHHSWQTSLLPQMDQAPLFEQIDSKVPWDDPKNVAFFKNEIPDYCRDSGELKKNSAGFGVSHWAANQYLMNRNSRIRFGDVRDGLTNTIMAGEVAGNFSPWGQPGNWRDLGRGINKGPDTFGNPSDKNGLFLMGDGSVRFISEDANPQLLHRLANHEDLQPLDADF